MHAEDKTKSKQGKSWWRKINFEFYYVEQIGNRHYMRFTPFGLISIIVSALLLFGYFIIVAWYDSYKQTNNNLGTPAASPYKQTEKVVTPGPSPSTPRSRNR